MLYNMQFYKSLNFTVKKFMLISSRTFELPLLWKNIFREENHECQKY